MIRFALFSLCFAVIVCGCASQEAVAPAQQSEVRAGFHRKPDVNTIKDPKMKAWVQGMIDASKKGQVHDVKPPKS